MLKGIFRRFTAAAISAAMLLTSAVTTASAEWEYIGCMGDLNHDSEVNIADLVLLKKHVLGMKELTLDNTYYIGYRAYMINLSEADNDLEHLNTADMNRDGRVDVFDLVAMRDVVINRHATPIFRWNDNSHINITTTTTTTQTTATTSHIVTEPEPVLPFIEAPINDVLGYMPSQGEAQIVIFYVDFPDCQYDYSPDEEEISRVAFGDEDEYDQNYPFESMRAFYSRASKGSMELTGKVFRYTAKESVHEYKTDKAKLVRECYEAFDKKTNFAKFDSNDDGYIDTTILSVPKAAGDEDWWPCTTVFGNDIVQYDGKKLGNLITSNDQIKGEDDFYDFNSTILHEMGHCMGLPDYYLYLNDESEGMHGYAGNEMMDIDASSDFCAFSKLQLGWYRENQVKVYTGGGAEQTFTLRNAQTDGGNCVIIPRGHLNGRYESEYFIIEYNTDTGNNSHPFWWQKTGCGVRIYHIEAELYDNGWWIEYKYENGSEFVTDPNGKRLIRLVNDAVYNIEDNYLRTGDVVDFSTKGFAWYDNSGAQTIDPGLKITIGDFSNDTYTITVSAS